MPRHAGLLTGSPSDRCQKECAALEERLQDLRPGPDHDALSKQIRQLKIAANLENGSHSRCFRLQRHFYIHEAVSDQ